MMRITKLFCLLLFNLVLLCPILLFAQEPQPLPVNKNNPTDSLIDIEILETNRLTIFKANDSTTLQILAGKVKLRQGTSLFYCDSCVVNNANKTFEAWGKVHINDSDTANIYANHLRYLINRKVAYLDGAVKLTDGKGTLTTPDLEYDMTTNIGIYTHGGKVVNKNTVLTSQEGYYYADLRDIYFKKNVILKDPAYNITTDSLLYNTTTQTTRFITKTFIRDSSGRTVETKDGYYNLQSGKAEFGQNPIIHDGPRIYKAITMFFDDSAQTAKLVGNAIVVDTAEGTTILAGIIITDRKNDKTLATNKPLMIIKQNNDSIYIAADTLFTARLSDLYGKKDSVSTDSASKSKAHTIGVSKINPPGKDSIITSINTDSLLIEQPDLLLADSIQTDHADPADSTIQINEPDDSLHLVTAVPVTADSAHRTVTVLNADSLQKKDSSNRYFEAYHHVRIYSDSLQAVGDSLFYSFRDSTFRLFQDPVIWSKESQITGDTILVFTKNKKADHIKVFNNSFMINRVEPEIYNQVQSTRMDGYFKEGSIDSVRAFGMAECIYFIQDEDSAYTGINESKCEIIDIYFQKEELQKVVFRSQVSGTIWPIRQKTPQEMHLPGFRWLDDRRPKTKYELFE